MLLYKMLQEEVNPDKTYKSMLWGILLMAGAVGVLGMSVAQLVMANNIGKTVGMAMRYGIGAMPIITVILSVGMIVTDAVMRKVSAKKEIAAQDANEPQTDGVAEI